MSTRELRDLLREVLPESMGGYPDLFGPPGGWEAWEERAKAALAADAAHGGERAHVSVHPHGPKSPESEAAIRDVIEAAVLRIRAPSPEADGPRACELCGHAAAVHDASGECRALVRDRAVFGANAECGCAGYRAPGRSGGKP